MTKRDESGRPNPAGTVYRGRFAPSPTGPLHFGSLISAVASYLEARHRGGEWLVRIEDLDPPREMAGASSAILHTLEAHGLHWDGPVVYQSRRTELYAQALQHLEHAALVYPCTCSRRDIQESQPKGRKPVYPGTCRDRRPSTQAAHALRLRTQGAVIGFHDRVQGPLRQDLEAEVGDFVVRRADGWYAYQLAVVVDDAAQGITDVVRGSDLLDSTPRQIHLQRLLGLPTPTYAHVPIAVDAAGRKLSKQNGAPALCSRHPVANLLRVLEFLDQAPPAGLADLTELWTWATAHWRPGRIPAMRAIAVTERDQAG